MKVIQRLESRDLIKKFNLPEGTIFQSNETEVHAVLDQFNVARPLLGKATVKVILSSIRSNPDFFPQYEYQDIIEIVADMNYSPEIPYDPMPNFNLTVGGNLIGSYFKITMVSATIQWEPTMANRVPFKSRKVFLDQIEIHEVKSVKEGITVNAAQTVTVTFNGELTKDADGNLHIKTGAKVFLQEEYRTYRKGEPNE